MSLIETALLGIATRCILQENIFIFLRNKTFLKNNQSLSYFYQFRNSGISGSSSIILDLVQVTFFKQIIIYISEHFVQYINLSQMYLVCPPVFFHVSNFFKSSNFNKKIPRTFSFLAEYGENFDVNSNSKKKLLLEKPTKSL